MVNVTLYTVSCEPNVVDKSSYAGTGTVKQGTIRGPLDVQEPEIEIQGDASAANYAHIDATGKYYRVLSCTRHRTDLSVVRLSVDVLWTYATDILALPAVVDRSAAMINSYLPDSKQKVYQYTQCNTHNIGSAFAYDNNPILITAG